jgi:hypothetical protein
MPGDTNAEPALLGDGEVAPQSKATQQPNFVQVYGHWMPSDDR